MEKHILRWENFVLATFTSCFLHGNFQREKLIKHDFKLHIFTYKLYSRNGDHSNVITWQWSFIIGRFSSPNTHQWIVCFQAFLSGVWGELSYTEGFRLSKSATQNFEINLSDCKWDFSLIVEQYLILKKPTGCWNSRMWPYSGGVTCKCSAPFLHFHAVTANLMSVMLDVQ